MLQRSLYPADMPSAFTHALRHVKELLISRYDQDPDISERTDLLTPCAYHTDL